MDKTSLKKALLEVKEIETFATKSAKQIMEQEFLPKIETSVRQALLEMEAKEMGEASEVTLDSGASVNVTVGADGKVTIKSADGTAPAVIGTPANALDTTTDVVTTELPATPEDVAPVIPTTEVPNMDSEIKTQDLENMTTPEEEELFEIVDDTEEINDEEIGADEKPAEETSGFGDTEAGTEEADTEEAGTEEAQEESTEEATKEKVEKMSQDMEEMKSMLEKILEKVGGEAEGDVEIVDDNIPGEDENLGGEETGVSEEPVVEPTEAGADEASEEEEIIFEFDDVLDETKNKDLEEIQNTLSEIEQLEENEEELSVEQLEEVLKEILGTNSLEEYGDEHPVTVKDALDGKEEELYEIEIENAEEMEENSSISLTNKQGQNLKPNTPHKKVRAGLQESDKARYESKLDELTKENESLKSVVNEYKESFVTLRKQINEVQTFNAKLAYANKVFTKGGLTNEEKAVISEQFDNCKNADEAKALYNKLIKESSVTKKPNVSKIQLPKAASSPKLQQVLINVRKPNRQL